MKMPITLNGVIVDAADVAAIHESSESSERVMIVLDNGTMVILAMTPEEAIELMPEGASQ